VPLLCQRHRPARRRSRPALDRRYDRCDRGRRRRCAGPAWPPRACTANSLFFVERHARSRARCQLCPVTYPTVPHVDPL
jgi:hypothetical protein